ncbi:MAG: hypothetical protein ACI4D5_03995 [Kineothrix sp.]
MNYAWEAALQADREGIPREKLVFVPLQDGSPYTEIGQEMINARQLDRAEVGINPLYRFAGVFAEIFDRNTEGYEKTRELLFRIFMQYMVQLDLRQGLSRQEYALRFLFRDIQEGVYGERAAEVICGIEQGKRRRLLQLILKLYRCGSSLHLFREVMRCMYPDSLVYASNEEVQQLLIYVGAEETPEEAGRLAFLRDMFLPVSQQVYLFWERHFGIIDVEETMVLDEMVLF